jgi:glycosyltransferase involved in cell wall biosynthesis
MRLLHVVPSYLPAARYGGPILAVHGLCRALAAMGHHVEVFTTNVDGPGDSAVPLGVPVPLDGVDIRYFRSQILRRLYWSPSLARALAGETAGFDVVHLHSVFLWPTWAAARAARKAGIPYLISPRGMLVQELIKRRSRYVKSAWIHLIEKFNLKHAAAVHVTSELEAAELKRFKWELPRIAMVPNGTGELESIPETPPSEDILKITAGEPIVLFLGRISWKKGLDRLLQAFALTSRGKLAIVGPDDEGLVPRLSRLAQRLRIADRVQFLPRTVLGTDKEHLFAAARLFVLPSYSENFGNTVLEAMRRGLPVVVTPEVGAGGIVREAGGGLVTGGEPGSVSNAISHLLADPDLARAMGEAGQRWVLEHYTWSRVATQMEALYDSLRIVNSGDRRNRADM